MASQLIDLYEAALPLDEMAEGMGDVFHTKRFTLEYRCLETILSELKSYPNQGTRLLIAALNSPVTRSRNMACHVVKGWMKKLGLPLSEISTQVYSAIKRISKIEINKSTSVSMENIIEGNFD